MLFFSKFLESRVVSQSRLTPTGRDMAYQFFIHRVPGKSLIEGFSEASKTGFVGPTSHNQPILRRGQASRDLPAPFRLGAESAADLNSSISSVGRTWPSDEQHQDTPAQPVVTQASSE